MKSVTCGSLPFLLILPSSEYAFAIIACPINLFLTPPPFPLPSLVLALPILSPGIEEEVNFPDVLDRDPLWMMEGGRKGVKKEETTSRKKGKKVA